jgi:hypothetical protein
MCRRQSCQLPSCPQQRRRRTVLSVRQRQKLASLMPRQQTAHPLPRLQQPRQPGPPPALERQLWQMAKRLKPVPTRWTLTLVAQALRQTGLQQERTMTYALSHWRIPAGSMLPPCLRACLRLCCAILPQFLPSSHDVAEHSPQSSGYEYTWNVLYKCIPIAHPQTSRRLKLAITLSIVLHCWNRCSCQGRCKSVCCVLLRTVFELFVSYCIALLKL